ncbi:hypothetical protein VNO77_33429 [Canavalia gladiata]|uniref:Gnk2-homologous domain-containing protein n=1 Tax=Canavalia gladiata TaxID=3824 RepID=A0AAN9PYW5_CANGL
MRQRQSAGYPKTYVSPLGTFGHQSFSFGFHLPTSITPKSYNSFGIAIAYMLHYSNRNFFTGLPRLNCLGNSSALGTTVEVLAEVRMIHHVENEANITIPSLNQNSRAINKDCGMAKLEEEEWKAGKVTSFFTFVTTQSQDNLFFIDQSCSSYDTSAKSVFHLNLNTLLSSLSSNASHSEFYNTTIVGENHTDSVYGVFMCRGDITPQLCQQCVQNATQRQPSDSECYLAKQAVIWYDVCMVRYSNHSFFSTLDTTPPFYLYNPVDADKQKSFMHLMFKAMNETADEAARGGIGEKYATREAKVSEFHTLYCLAQCTPDLSPLHCRTCLNQAIGDLPSCCQGTIGGRVLYPSCNIRYELYPFYRPNIVPSPTPTPIFVPASNFSKEDSRLSEYPIYLFHNCSDNATFTANSTFQLYLNTLLSDLSSKATSGNKFHKEGVADTVYGLFMCRGDLPSGFCGQCVLNATHRIASACSLRQEAIIWYSHCLLRYSYRYFFSQLQTSPMFSELNITPVSGPTPEQSYFTFELSNALEKLAVGDSSEKYVTLRSKLNAIQTLYTLAQCTQDLSGDDCDKCLEDLIGTAIPWSQLGSVGGRVLYPSCNLRFELFQFYSDHDVGQAPPPRPSHTSLPSSGSTGTNKVCFVCVSIRLRKSSNTYVQWR